MAHAKDNEPAEGLAYPKNLGLFYNEPLDVSLEHHHFMEYPSTSSEDGDIIEFNIPPSSEYIDLPRTRVFLKCQILQGNGDKIPKPVMRTRDVDGVAESYQVIDDVARVCVTSLFIASIFKQCQVSLNNVIFSPYVSTGYSFKGFLDTILYASEFEKKTELKKALYYKDSVQHCNDIDPFTTENSGLYKRHAFVRDSKIFSVGGRIYSDLFEIKKLLLSNIELNIKFWKNTPSFCLISSKTLDPSYKIKIHEAKLVVCYVRPSASLMLAQAKLLKDNDVVYNYNGSIIKTVSLSSGDRSHTVDNLFNGDIPSSLVVGLISTEAFMGNYKKNSWVFSPHQLSYISLSLDGSFFPFSPMMPKFVKDKFEDCDIARTYMSLFSGSIKADVSPEEFCENLCIYVFEVNRVRKGTKCLQRRGITRLSLDFSEPLAQPTTIVLYGRFPSFFRVTESRNIRMS
jgi:hypothetical protein